MLNTPDIDERIEKCQQILDRDPNSQIFAALAEAYRKKGDLDKSFRICKNGLRVHPSYGSAHLVMAKINLDRGLYDWAEIEVKRASEIDGHTRTVDLLQAEVHIYRGEFNPAIKILKRLHQFDPNNQRITKLLDIAQKLPAEQVAAMDTPQSHEATDESEPTPVGPVVPEPQKALEPREIIERAVAVAGIDGALFMKREGLVVDTQWTSKLDVTMCGACMADVSEHLSRELVKNSFGKVGTILIETGGGIFYQVHSDKGIFVFVANTRANLGSIRMKIDNLFGMFTK